MNSIPPKLLLSQLKHLSTKPGGTAKPAAILEPPAAEPDSTVQLDIEAPASNDMEITSLAPDKSPVKPQPSAPEKPQESLPVLQAFQQFLDVERKRTRTRMITLTLVFIAVFVVIAAISLTVALTYTRQLRKDFLDMKDQVAVTQQDAQKVNNDTRTALQTFETEASKLRGDVLSVSDSTAAIKSRTESYDAALGKLSETVNSLVIQNDALRSDMARFKSPQQTEPEPLRYQSIRESKQPQPAETDRSPSTIVMPIVPRGMTNAVAWRIPLPE